MRVGIDDRDARDAFRQGRRRQHRHAAAHRKAGQDAAFQLQAVEGGGYVREVLIGAVLLGRIPVAGAVAASVERDDAAALHAPRHALPVVSRAGDAVEQHQRQPAGPRIPLAVRERQPAAANAPRRRGGTISCDTHAKMVSHACGALCGAVVA